ncbi:MAG: PAS domain-containing sensor histidine kinase, partial [Prevotella sp.]
KQVERENTLYNMAVENSHTFAWERYGETIYLSDTFWRHYGHEPHVCDVDEFMDMIHPDYRKEYLSGVEMVNRGQSYSGEVKADFYRNGEWHWYQIRGKGVFDDNGKYIRSYGMLLKVDDYKLKEYQLDEARRLAEEATLKESFLANMSHEIRTPLNAIVGFSQLLAMPGEEYSPEEKAMFIDAIMTNNDLLLKLVNDIVDLSCVESGEMKFVIKTHSASAIVTNAYNKYKATVPDNLDFRLALPEDGGDDSVDVDENRLDIIFKNLIANAVKYTNEGSITIGWQRATGRYDVEIYVEDTGCGLADDDAKMVFNRFYKKDKFQQGTGLGLSICKAVAIRLDGDIKVKSKVGEGTRFSVFLN